MKFFIGISWIGILIILSNLLNLYKSEKVMNLILFTLMFDICLNLNIKFNFKHNGIYVTSYILSLIIYSLLINKNEKIKTINHLNKTYFIHSTFIIIFLIYIYQFLNLEIYNYNLFFINLITFVSIYMMYYMFKKFSTFKYNYETIIKIITVFSIANSILGIFQFIFNKTFLPFNSQNIEYQSIIEVKRVVGFIAVNNAAGNLGALFFPVLLYNYMKNKKIINAISIILNIIFVILTLTRIGYLGIIIESLIFLYLEFKNSKYKNQLKIIISSLFFIVLIGVIFKFYGNKIYYILFEGRGNTQNGRIVQFNYVINKWLIHPILGSGSGQYVDYVYNNYGLQDIVIHSQYLNILFEQGIISFICFLSFNIYLYINLLRKKIYSNWFIHSLFWGNLIVTNFNPNQYYQLNIFLYYFIIFALLYADDTIKNNSVVNISIKFKNVKISNIST